ncbi:MAG: type II toxin-antitoxin system HicA family toxin [Nitrospinae bacterium]|nr:type II toxin-antitoxin system HicA family toxin [Nitrospinota bacterium]
MKQVSGKDLIRTLERNGWRLMRIQGSHHIYGKVGEPLRISVPVHGSHPLKPGILKHFMKIAGLDESDF